METSTVTLSASAAPLTKENQPLTYNECVHRAYKLIHLWAIAALATVEDDALRGTLIREDPLPVVPGKIVHEMVSPLLYLRLECYQDGNLYIRFGYEPSSKYSSYYPLMASFVRMLYKLTSKKASQVNIEEAVRITHIQTDCAELFDYMQEVVSRHHRFEQIAYKPATIERKLQKVA